MPNPLKKVYFICTCKCEIEKNDLIRNKKKQLCCPEHLGRVTGRYTSCEYPGCKTIRFFSAGRGTVPGYCIEHQKERDLLRRRKFTREYYHKNKFKFNKNTRSSKRKKYDHLFDDTKLDCSKRFDCLGKYDKFDTVPCKGCKEYNPHPLCDDDTSTNRNFSAGTSHRVCL